MNSLFATFLRSIKPIQHKSGGEINAELRDRPISRATSFKRQKTLTTTSDEQLFMMARKIGLKLNAVCMKDQITAQNLAEGNYIINLNNSNQSGSHWVCFIKKNRNIYYCDSFGAPPPQREKDLFKELHLNVSFNLQQNQDLKSSSCGYWCLYWLYWMNTCPSKINMQERMTKFNQMFSQNYKGNENVLREHINQLLK